MKLLHNSLLDQNRWDRLVLNSLNGNVYGLSWYLNITCPGWEALIDDDHQSVMPVPVTRDWHHKFIRQPSFTWQLGVFSNRRMDHKLMEKFLSKIPRNYHLSSLNLNKLNNPGTLHYKFKELEHAELDLIPSYPQIRRKYSNELAKGLNDAGSRRLSVLKGLTANDFLQFMNRLDASNSRKIKSRDLQCLRLIISSSIRFRLGELYGAYTPDNTLCGVAFIVSFKQKASLICTGANKEGMLLNAVAAIVDEFIKLHAEQKLILGADNPDDMRIKELLLQFGGNQCRFFRITGRR